VKTAAVLALLGAFLTPAKNGARPKWTLGQAKAVLTQSAFSVTDENQPDRPEYRLSFNAHASRSLRVVGRLLVFTGSAHDVFTDRDVRVRFNFVRPGRISAFHGPAADTSQPSFPIRAAFYYAWYPEAWFRYPILPYTRFRPSLDLYSADDARIVRAHTDAMLYAHLDAGIYSWWGRDGYPPTDARFGRYLTAARTTPFRWAVYYEREGYANPSVETIRSDLEYIRDAYASRPAYLKVDGRLVVYVYGGSEDSCDTVARWRSANTVGAYIVLKAFDGFRSCAAQPDAWHQYSAALPEYDLAPDAFMIAPGFEEQNERSPRLSRNPMRWRTDVAAMIASHARWELVLTFNEWPEGTSIESAHEWASPSGYGDYLDVLHEVLPSTSVGH
jgi:hypothetical protein